MTTTRERTTAAEPTEVGRTLADESPRNLTGWDAAALWGNLGVSLLGFTGAIFVLQPTGGAYMSLAAAFVALIVGTALGTLGVAAAGVPGSDTGAPSMVLLRGLFGTRPSYLPTALNVVQLVGWTTFELVTIGTALHQIADGVPKWVFVLAGGAVSTGLALRPLGWIRVLRKYVTAAVVIALIYLLVQLLRHPLPSWTHGGWGGFWIAVDSVIGVTVSWVPLVSDYSRHARSTGGTFAGTFVGYSITQIFCYVVGLIALVTVTHGDSDQIFGAFMAIPVGTVAFGVLAVRELDQSFADTYSTAVSLQNYWPRADRRLLAVLIGTVATVCALALNIDDYQNFLTLIGSVFTPLLGVLIADYFLVSRRHWELGARVRPRWSTLAAWVIGFGAYQVVNPGYIGWWTRMWGHVDSWLHITVESWMSASLISFAVAAVATLVLALARRMFVLVSRVVSLRLAGSARRR
jgi:putative hydroxymethylpyrimidine transporter CytX